MQKARLFLEKSELLLAIIRPLAGRAPIFRGKSDLFCDARISEENSISKLNFQKKKKLGAIEKDTGVQPLVYDLFLKNILNTTTKENIQDILKNTKK